MDIVDRKTRSYIMSKIRSVSSIERVPSCLTGLRLRHQPRGVFGRPDFANKRRKIALFIDGDFFHGKRPWRCPKTNSGFWRRKILRNRKRDREVGRELGLRGWAVIRIWESDLPAARPAGACGVKKAVRG